MTLSVLSATHALSYRALMLHAYEHAADAFTSTVEERAAEPDAWWLRRIADPHGLTIAFGTFDGGSLVGTVALEFSAKPKTCHQALVVGMYVLPEQRGKGLARALMQAAIAHCVQRGDIVVVQLTATEGNEPALRLYRQLGFQSFGTEPLAVRTPGGFRGKVHLALELARPTTGPPGGAGQDTAEAVVQRQLDAYNARDLPAWLATYAEDARQFELGGALIAQGRGQIGARMSARFREPHLHARLIRRVVIGQVVIDHEHVTRTLPSGPDVIELVCIYVVERGAIQTATFRSGPPTANPSDTPVHT